MKQQQSGGNETGASYLVTVRIVRVLKFVPFTGAVNSINFLCQCPLKISFFEGVVN